MAGMVGYINLGSADVTIQTTMFLLRALVVTISCAAVFSLRTPPRTLSIKGAESKPIEDAPTARHMGASKAQSILNRLDDELNGARLDVTTYAPRPTTSMPQTQLRSLCLTPRGKFPHPLDCRKYVDCWDGRVLEKRCPNDLVYSDLPGEFCDYLEYVDCGTRPVLLDSNEQVVVGANLPIAQPPQVPAQAPVTNPPPVIKWVKASNGSLPSGAVPAGGNIGPNGVNDQSMFVGRALVDGSVIPCTLVPRAEGCYVAWDNQQILFRDYEVLQSNNPRWVAMTADSPIPQNAIPTGILDVSPIQRMYTGRALIGNALVPGYLSEGSRQLIQARDGGTYFTTSYEILVQGR